jgi:hypothetical protein
MITMREDIRQLIERVEAFEIDPGEKARAYGDTEERGPMGTLKRGPMGEGLWEGLWGH